MLLQRDNHACPTCITWRYVALTTMSYLKACVFSVGHVWGYLGLSVRGVKIPFRSSYGWEGAFNGLMQSEIDSSVLQDDSPLAGIGRHDLKRRLSFGKRLAVLCELSNSFCYPCLKEYHDINVTCKGRNCNALIFPKKAMETALMKPMVLVLMPQNYGRSSSPPTHLCVWWFTPSMTFQEDIVNFLRLIPNPQNTKVIPMQYISLSSTVSN